MSWNQQKVDDLKKLWNEGVATSRIGEQLGFTKNAVVGKAHRIGLERRPSPIRRTAVKPDRKKARSPVMPKLNFENSVETTKVQKNSFNSFTPLVNNLFAPIKKRGCEWPVGHPDEPEFHFCDKERFEDKPYCIDHCAVAYVIPEKEESEKQPIVQTT